MKGLPPPLYAETVTKYVFVESYKTTPEDLAREAYEAREGVMIKETCFGLQITGREDEVEAVVRKIRAVDPPHIYVKDRGFPPGDPRRCRANLGGARPGFFGLEFEIGIIRRISKGIEALDPEAESESAQFMPIQLDKPYLEVSRLKAIIDTEVA